MDNNKDIIATIVSFLKTINISVVQQKLSGDTFLPGLRICGETILMDLDKLQYPGDILHEAGHIAVTEEEMRSHIGTSKIRDNWPTDGEEIAAILWSYAASFFLNIDLEVVFHPNGYKNESEWLIEQFNNKNYIGLPLLEWMSLCDKKDFPKMKKWIR